MEIESVRTWKCVVSFCLHSALQTNLKNIHVIIDTANVTHQKLNANCVQNIEAECSSQVK